MSELFDPIKFEKILNELNINKGDKLLVNSNILNLLIKNRNKISPNQIIDVLIKKISTEGTLLFPTYNWGFCKGLVFDYLNTKSSTGALSNISLKRDDFVRSKNPIYSFSIFGKDKIHISNLNHRSCFGFDSPFGYLIENKGKNLFIDLDYKEALTFVHVAEEKAKVDYRYHKNFSSFYIDKNKNRKKENYKMFVRKEEIVKSTLIYKKFYENRVEKKVIKKKNYDGINFSAVDISIAFKLMFDDLESKSGLIYPDLY